MNLLRTLMFLLLISMSLTALAEQIGSEFTYQGELKYLDEPAKP